MLKHFFTSFILLSIVIKTSGQSSSSSSYLNFNSNQRMVIYLDSAGNFELTMGWEKVLNKVTIDAFGNRIKIKGPNDIKEKLFILGVRGKKYQSSGTLSIVPFSNCTDDKDRRCSIRLMLQDSENIGNSPSYLYIDYSDVTYVYQLFFTN